MDAGTNRKNPGSVEEEPMSKADERQFYRAFALGWTIAATLYTAYAFWTDNLHRQETAWLGWLMTALAWGAWAYETRKSKKKTP